jgi:hypothetical protein
MTVDEFFDVIAKNRTLTTQGLGVADGTKETFEDERPNLASCFEEANACEEFLKTRNRTEKPNKAAGSTKDIIHEVERYSSSFHFREGALILAALYLGFEMRQVRNQTSVYLNISKR